MSKMFLCAFFIYIQIHGSSGVSSECLSGDTCGELVAASEDGAASDPSAIVLLQRSHQVNGPMCINAQAALEYEHHRLLDWIAYHNLLGIECFFLHLDMCHSNLSSPEQLRVYNALHAMQLPLAHVIEHSDEMICDTYERDPPANLMSSIRPKYLMNIDLDEYLVLDSGPCVGTAEDARAHQSLAKPPSIIDFLENTVSQQGVGYMYAHRHTYGTSGYTKQPSSPSTMPEFYFLDERVGNCLRTDPHISGPKDEIPETVRNGDAGKIIMIAPFGDDAYHYVGHFIDLANAKNRNTIYPNGTRACESLVDIRMGAEGLRCGPVLPSTPQHLFINHYVTGALEDCMKKGRTAQSRRRKNSMTGRTDGECRFYHPGTSEYEKHKQFMVTDAVLVKYGAVTRNRAAEIFIL
eukprot:TRINITY_DN647_c0_g1_i7.p1 TRINITY_DN647_c0_g1~~TRINITY_DN647_c0_g1_i7.p1  ORF type:complete len:427 (-),score=47.34 TRINITY_DN647_c0_g1_i7:200-1420(-)